MCCLVSERVCIHCSNCCWLWFGCRCRDGGGHLGGTRGSRCRGLFPSCGGCIHQEPSRLVRLNRPITIIIFIVVMLGLQNDLVDTHRVSISRAMFKTAECSFLLYEAVFLSFLSLSLCVCLSFSFARSLVCPAPSLGILPTIRIVAILDLLSAQT